MGQAKKRSVCDARKSQGQGTIFDENVEMQVLVQGNGVNECESTCKTVHCHIPTLVPSLSLRVTVVMEELVRRIDRSMMSPNTCVLQGVVVSSNDDEILISHGGLLLLIKSKLRTKACGRTSVRTVLRW
jgi:hypothetical protein